MLAGMNADVAGGRKTLSQPINDRSISTMFRRVPNT
jgi:hypothetical protein